MRIRVTQVYKRNGASIVVSFKSTYGSGDAVWHGEVAPEINHVYDVELDVEGKLIWGQNIRECQTAKYAIDNEDGKLILQGKIEYVDEDGIAALRIGDSLVTLEIVGDAVPAGLFVRVLAEVRLFEYDV
jgi:hypothetical protein